MGPARSLRPTHSYAAPAPLGALWFIGKNPEGHFSDTLFQVVKGTRKMLGFLPTGLDWEGQTPLVSLFWSIKETEKEACLRRGLSAWKKEVLELVPKADFLLDQIESFDQLSFAAYYDVVMWDWHHRNVVIPGRLHAHAMSPQLGQGVNLGFYDAMVLADCLEEGNTLAEALPEYSRRRMRHLDFYQFVTRWATPFFQSSTPGLSVLRDYGFAFLNAVLVFRRQMIRSMAGLKRGFLRKSLSYFEIPPELGSE
jgi:2-polyprenyl-6-methoxyphenol hydroxylase-like FAD-dependent oxidoreductase